MPNEEDYRIVHYESLNGYYKMSPVSYGTIEQALEEAKKLRSIYAVVKVVHKLMED